jgi:hypothetical protein
MYCLVCPNWVGKFPLSALPTSLVLIILTRVWVRVTKITGSSSDDWIYWHFGYNLS